MIAYAGAEAFSSEAYNIIGGWNVLDASNYPDCRADFLKAAQVTLNHAMKRGKVLHNWYRIYAPLIRLSKKDIVLLGTSLKAPLELTWSCYMGGDRPCGKCDTCQLRALGFLQAGVVDPALSSPVGEIPEGAVIVEPSSLPFPPPIQEGELPF